MKRITVMGIAAFWENDKPHGLGCELNMLGHADTRYGMRFCERLSDLVDAVPGDITAEETLEFFHMLSRQKLSRVEGDPMEEAEGLAFMRAISWMQVMGHLKADEYNGTMFTCLIEENGQPSTIALFECNPATLDIEEEIALPTTVDMTDIMRASPGPTDKGTLAAVRTVANHAREMRDQRKGES